MGVAVGNALATMRIGWCYHSDIFVFRIVHDNRSDVTVLGHANARVMAPPRAGPQITRFGTLRII
jgi:hypothetical protein